ncbi:MAG TPA: IS1634 family transposase [Acetobacteraceae bacterium]|nr:IS1634 family transposase [Acetobacteraceae bacterium]
MHIHVIPNRDSPPTVLLRESYRDGKTVRKRTLANLSSLPAGQIELIRQVLRGEKLVTPASLFEIDASRHHGHVQAVWLAMQRLGLPQLLSTRACAERQRVLAMIAARVLSPHSKLATTRWWDTTTLPELFELDACDEQALYAAMDWLLERQDAIQGKLAQRHLQPGSIVLYDLSSSYFEGSTCELAALGYNRDGKRGKLQVNYGLLTDGRGVPVAISVFEGNTADADTFMPQVTQLRERFGIDEMVLVGDRGMIAQTHIDALRAEAGVQWITALKSGSLRVLASDGALQLGLFDERNLFEFTHADYPGERLVACRNPELAKMRAHKRQALLEATVALLEPIRQRAAAGRLKGQDRIGLSVGKVLNRHKVGKHFDLEIGDASFGYTINEARVAQEASLDGIYVIRTAVPRERMDSDDVVRNYKNLSQVEQAFRSMKSVDLEVRPIYHRLADRVRAHLLLCMLAYYVKWHMMQAWRPLLFADEEQAAKAQRDPVAPARRSASALRKVSDRTLEDGTCVHSFDSLLHQLSTIVRNACHHPGVSAHEATFTLDTAPDAKQLQALELLKTIAV